jgi:putative ABC transport system substrate-binding protein
MSTRREFITALGGAAAMWPVAARAQQAVMPVIGFLIGSSSSPSAPFVAGFRRGLNEAGFTEGQNVAIEYRWAEGRYDQLPAMAADLARRRVAVIVAAGVAAPLAAKAATASIPIVFMTIEDPVKMGLVRTFSRPVGMITGVHLMAGALGPKRLDILRQLLSPNVDVGLLINPNSPAAATFMSEFEAAARTLGQQNRIVAAGSERELEEAFSVMAARRPSAMIVTPDEFFYGQRQRLVELAARFAVPTVYALREFVAAGGLMSYGINLADAFRHGGVYVGRILKGEKPADLPVIQPTKFELVINLKTAKALGLEISPTLLALADEVIE